MKRILSLGLALLMIAALAFTLAACGDNDSGGGSGGGGTAPAGAPSGTFNSVDEDATITFSGNTYTITVMDDEIGVPISFSGPFTFNNDVVTITLDSDSLAAAVIDLMPAIMGDEWDAMVELFGEDGLDAMIGPMVDMMLDIMADEFDNLQLTYDADAGTLSDNGEVAFRR